MCFFIPIWVIYSILEREHKRIQAKKCEKLSHSLTILKREVDKSKRIFYELSRFMGKGSTTPREWNTKKSHCVNHSKI